MVEKTEKKLKLNKIAILLLLVCAMCVQTAYASPALTSSSLAKFDAATLPEANMQSTSAFLNSSAPQMSYKQASTRRMNPSAQMSFRALRTTSAAKVQTVGMRTDGISVVNIYSNSNTNYKRTYAASSSGIAGMTTVSLPALSITDKNLASAARAFTGDDEENTFSTTSRPRRVEGEGDDPNEPYIDAPYTPVGSTPWLLFVLLSGIYVAFRLRSRKQQSTKSL